MKVQHQHDKFHAAIKAQSQDIVPIVLRPYGDVPEPIPVTALATAFVTNKLHPAWLTGKTWIPNTSQDGKPQPLTPKWFLDNTTAGGLRTLLGAGAKVVQLTPNELWIDNAPNTANATKVSLANFLQWPNGMVVSCADIATEGSIPFSVSGLDREAACEWMLSFVIPGGVVSARAQAQYDNSPAAKQAFSTVVPATPVYWTGSK